MSEWNYFFSTSAGVAGGLIGLIFVAISVNHSRILASPTLSIRALTAITFLVTILTKGLLFLVPEQTKTSLGIATAISTLLLVVVIEVLELRILRRIDRALQRKQWIGFALAQLALAPFIICSISLLLARQQALYWIVPGVLLSFLKALIDAWILLIEANR